MTTVRKSPALKARTPRVRIAKIAEPDPPPKPKRTRIVWNKTERALLIEAGIDIVRSDPTGKLSILQALKRAVIRLKQQVRPRPLHAVAPKYYEWFRVGVEAGISAPAPPTPAPEPPAPPTSEFDAVRIVVAKLGEIVERVVETVGDISRRLVPVEKSAAIQQRVLFAIVKELDPNFLAEFEEPEPPAADRNGHADPLPLPVLSKPPRARICIVGLRPDAQQVVREKINGRATLTFVLEADKAVKKGFAHYNAVVITRHSAHAVFGKATLDLGSRHVVRLETTSANKVIEQVERFVEQHAKEYKPQPAGVR